MGKHFAGRNVEYSNFIGPRIIKRAIAVSAIYVDDSTLKLDAMVLRPNGETAHRRQIVGPAGDATRLGTELGTALLFDAGGKEFLI